MASWKKTITTPFRKACKVFNQQTPRDDKKSQTGPDQNRVMDLQGEVMACGYEDVQVMWSILDKSKPTTACRITSS
ncbi:SsrA-binding protein [Quillaja saponaria]|uniref:SsrA-binding protein n=1 Tax=Quillaja saponaria TaxID=32244 RepID=A0AAD7PHU7_QUISA|nr:SsrA-binding protein [Quillaja saponaria]